ncbi:hypothetical protein A5645_22625 [Mycobacterium asiaticum]|nr:hypothetical protein A5645_22625 [Mycobacterium asiaticum]
MPGVSVVTVSGGSVRVTPGVVLGAVADGGDMLGGLVLGVADGVVDMVGVIAGRGGSTVALVVALSPLLMITAVAIAPIAMSAPTNSATGRQRRSAGQAHSSVSSQPLSSVSSQPS